MSQVDSQKRKN